MVCAGAAAGLFTAWVERKLIGAGSAAFDLERVATLFAGGKGHPVLHREDFVVPRFSVCISTLGNRFGSRVAMVFFCGGSRGDYRSLAGAKAVSRTLGMLVVLRWHTASGARIH